MILESRNYSKVDEKTHIQTIFIGHTSHKLNVIHVGGVT